MNKRTFTSIAKIPKEEGAVQLACFRGVIVVVSEHGPTRIVVENKNGSCELKVMDFKK